jgi:hypothetical protein
VNRARAFQSRPCIIIIGDGFRGLSPAKAFPRLRWTSRLSTGAIATYSCRCSIKWQRLVYLHPILLRPYEASCAGGSYWRVTGVDLDQHVVQADERPIPLRYSECRHHGC